ncbi:bifunctional tRNA (5-methylaminomethyl-2-thiouridine)(34)-methyltransferase MnmD/FAD-dependent 5-carboxymethylaminomethyl-2-thiouridine(34) oxidoreductase MnmC [Endozoicomonas elysicola]|uniref:bifunctional tRNA (5-methylaminomethyl-2-thiouridine)(34)-methyltransferase MnmD/FAD-dependent 5-carboxymethylaminomethyl-2-thiouridine(34) oxidoreductase MnmC n=1 Tax=Endozoicomonas elysicola TaxID=305900 RepID=UPI0012F74EE7|nr:bifunctional tRNA (5-methylaminomethyl-2-thiouridine)(34)-methyltransferase MnmD/FAD-dependent 5-carboxymethylaminomethyl-2-thiouridine(34) oxidoreductase MnmC [Endozoicomonas elysicola]
MKQTTVPDRQSPSHNKSQLSTAAIHWENDLPISTQFDDFYFSRVSGVAESHHVFLEQNQLTGRFQTLTPGATFTIGETGFGTGLNFLCAWQLFLENAPNDCSLNFISTEKYPLKPDDMHKALGAFEELSHLTHEMVSAYKLDPENINLQFFDSASNKSIHLSVLIGDVLDTLPRINKKVDAWFLDGFSPAKNPDMWQPGLFQTLKAKSHEQTTYATFTAARLVRDGLTNAGFSVTRQPGFGKKRDMISGQLIPSSGLPTATKPWFAPARHQNPDKNAIIIGGGLAGCSTARSLAKRGWQVTILEQHDSLAREASGNPQGVLYAKLSADNTPLSQFIVKGYHYTLSLLKTLEVQEWSSFLWQQCGVIQLAIDEKTNRRYQALDTQHPDTLLKYLDDQQLSEIAGLTVNSPGLYFPEAGWVNPPAFCRALANHPNIKVVTNTVVTGLEASEQGWIINTRDEALKCKTVVIAQGTASHQLPLLDYLPLKAIRGQITQVKATTESQQLASCVCGEGYIAPAIDDAHTMGATFHFKDNSTEVREADHKENLAMQAEHFPAMYQSLGGSEATVTGGRTGFRCTTPDYLPVVGPVVNTDRFLEIYAPLRKNSKLLITETPDYLDGLYITAGHGSRGMISCPIAGETLATMITGMETEALDNEQSPSMSTKLLEALHPSRFLIRDLIRNKV